MRNLRWGLFLKVLLDEMEAPWFNCLTNSGSRKRKEQCKPINYIRSEIIATQTLLTPGISKPIPASQGLQLDQNKYFFIFSRILRLFSSISALSIVCHIYPNDKSYSLIIKVKRSVVKWTSQFYCGKFDFFVETKSCVQLVESLNQVNPLHLTENQIPKTDRIQNSYDVQFIFRVARHMIKQNG